MEDLLTDFLTETAENLSVLDMELVKLEQDPHDLAILGNIFRLVHTIKGTCGFLGLPRLEHVAHAAENVLGKIRDGELPITPSVISLVLQSLDCIRGILAVLEATEREPVGSDEVLIADLNALADGNAPNKSDIDATEAAREFDAVVVKAVAHEPPAVSEIPPAPAAVEPSPAPVAAVPARVQLREVPPPPHAADSHGNDEHDRHPAAGNEAKGGGVAQTIRVNLDLLDNLMTMVSELVLSRNQLMQIARRYKDSEFTVPLQSLSHVTSELQEGVMKTRMQPIGNAWSKMPRLIRDLSIELGKKIDLQMIGAETELDRQVLELIKDPLTHMVRNSADHGIEPPDQRIAAGKPETGRLTLNAYHEGGHIIIDISDDGRGLDLQRIKQKAISSGLVTEAEVEQMADQQIQQFIFKAGFSTAAKVTSVSGRGVGMDVVRTNIEKIGGTVELKSQFGKGSSFIVKIPLTLAIVSALIVESCGERFAIPQISVVELVRASAQSEHRIERLHGAPVLRLRDRLLPLVSLEKLLQLDRPPADEKSESFIVVIQIGTSTFGIMVDGVFDTEEIVVKPVAPILRNLPLFSGNTILGDGSVIMILDPNGIATLTGEISVTEAHAREAATPLTSHAAETTALLLFRAGAGGPKAVPLALIARLEEFDPKMIELSGEQPMVQYRDRLMPLVPLTPGLTHAETGRQAVLVFADGDRSMGLMVDEIIDIVETRVSVEQGSGRPGVLGSAIIAGKATDLIDASFFLRTACADWFKASNGQINRAFDRSRRVLVVDDSPFFRNLMKPMLSVAGYDVTAVTSADEAIRLCATGAEFDAIVSDIEMPGMTGLEFAKAMRADPRWQNTPMVALSSHTLPQDRERGRQAGFNDYIAKFDGDALLQTLNETFTYTTGIAA